MQTYKWAAKLGCFWLGKSPQAFCVSPQTQQFLEFKTTVKEFLQGWTTPWESCWGSFLIEDLASCRQGDPACPHKPPWSPCPSLLPLFVLRGNSSSWESSPCTPLADLRCVSGLLGQALPRVSKAQIRDSICTSFSLMSSSSSSCFGKPVLVLSREFCGGQGGRYDGQSD